MNCKRTLSNALLGAILLLVPSTAMAQYQFNPVCAPETPYPTANGSPDVLIIVDQSGSMGWNGKWGIARDAIKAVATSTQVASPNDIRLGLGYFSTGSGVPVPPAEDSAANIANWLDNNGPDASTQTGEAAEELSTSPALANPARIGVGVIITDGAPDSNATIAKAIGHICEGRRRAVSPFPTFMVGLGVGSDQATNSFMSAAGGTGECCQGSGCTYQPSELYDPCDLGTSGNPNSYSLSGLPSSISCRGSLEANDATTFKNALLAIAEQAACTFPLAIPNAYPPGEGASDDPDATRVLIDHSVFGADTRVSHFDPGSPDDFYNYLVGVGGVAPAAADPYRGEGWYFSSALRNSVTFTPKLCADINNNQIATTKTTVACLCDNTGNNCEVAAAEGRCKPGFYACVVCVDDPMGNRPDGCASEPDGATNVCTSIYTPQPEICNGIDDNCDGSTDNVDSAEPGVTPPNATPWNSVIQPVPDSRKGLFCSYRNTCSCGTNQPPELDPDLRPGTVGNEWNQMVADWDGTCLCGEGLEVSQEDASLTPDNADDIDADAGCSSSNTSHAPVPGLLFFLLGVSVLGWRRKR